MNQLERRATLSLATIFSFRMLGLFMILPVFSLYADNLDGTTPTLLGIALGIYGLTQAFLQMPFGMLSDKFGRKPIILLGLILFVIGSVVAALSTSIYGVIIGRALQGAGAIGSTLIALLADLTSEKERTKSLATIGVTIGITFSIAMIAGPLLNAWVSLHGIFWFTAALAFTGILILFTWVPSPAQSIFHADAEPVPALFKKVLRDKELLRLNFGILVLHAMLTASFVVIPIRLESLFHLPEAKQWMLYLPVFVMAFVAMIPMIIIAEKRQKMKVMLLLAISMITLTQFILGMLSNHLFILAFLLFIFFTAFTFLEATLPSLISKQAPANYKGTAMGIYSSSQFLGIFIGGACGGWLYGHHYSETVFIACGLLGVLWLFAAIGMGEIRGKNAKTL